jgi:hypothetical protein
MSKIQAGPTCAALLLVGAILGACSGDADPEETGPVDAGLFACELPPSCEELQNHLGYAEPASAVTCAAKLVAEGRRGVLLALDTPGPSVDEIQRLILVLGDGTALVQRRERHCDRIEDCPGGPAWESASEQQLCDVIADAEMVAACQSDGQGCRWSPWHDLLDCRAAEALNCDAAAELVTEP